MRWMRLVASPVYSWIQVLVLNTECYPAPARLFTTVFIFQHRFFLCEEWAFLGTSKFLWHEVPSGANLWWQQQARFWLPPWVMCGWHSSSDIQKWSLYGERQPSFHQCKLIYKKNEASGCPTGPIWLFAHHTRATITEGKLSMSLIKWKLALLLKSNKR